MLTLEYLTHILDGVGEHPSTLESPRPRLYLPVDLRHGLAELFVVPWIVFLWNVSCLRAIPFSIWPEYKMRYLVPAFTTVEDKEFLQKKILKPAYRVIKTDERGRWSLSPRLFADGMAEMGPGVLITPEGPSLEIWDQEVKKKIDPPVKRF